MADLACRARPHDLWLGELNSRLSFAASERAGLEYVMALRRLIEPLNRSRGLRLLADTGDPAARAALAHEQARVVAAAAAVDATNDRLGDTLGVSQLWESLRHRVTHPSVEPGLLVTEAQRLMEEVANASNLSLDPDLDSYYMMDATVSRLPALAHQLATIGAGEVDQRISRTPGFSRQATLLAVLGQAQAERDALDRGHLVAFRANPKLRQRLESGLAQSWKAVDSVGAMVDGQTPEGGSAAADDPTPAAADARAAQALAALFVHHDAVAAALDDLLRARIAGIEAKRRLLLLIVAAFMLMVAYLWVGFYSRRHAGRLGARARLQAHAHGRVHRARRRRDPGRAAPRRRFVQPRGGAPPRRNGSAPRTRARGPTPPRPRWPPPATRRKRPRAPSPSSSLS